jgi:hypothetical protein
MFKFSFKTKYICKYSCKFDKTPLKNSRKTISYVAKNLITKLLIKENIITILKNRYNL